MRNRGAKNENKVVRCEARFRNRHAGIEFRLEGKAKFPVPHRQTRKPEGSAEATRPIYRMIAIHRESWTECGILVYRAARGDFRSIKVTSISCLIRSRSREPERRFEIFIAWRLINENSQMLALHIFLDYFKNARYMATRLTLVANELLIAAVIFNNLIPVFSVRYFQKRSMYFWWILWCFKF